MTINFRQTAAWIVRKRPYELNANGQRRYGPWETIRRVDPALGLDRAVELARQESALAPRGMWDVGVFRRGRRVWPA